jgi:cell division ATPase FtsA
MGAVAQARRTRAPAVAGVELGADRVRVAVGHRDDGLMRITGVAQAPLRPGVMAGGLVVDRDAVGGAIASALSVAEAREKATRVMAAIDGDDIRTYHLATTFEREALNEPMSGGEVTRAVQEARADAERSARAAAVNDAALRGIATVQLRDDVAGLALDGRPLASLVGFQGRYVEVRTDVSLAPLVLASAASGALDAAKRRGTVTAGAYALGRLLAASGLVEGAVLRLGADVTAFAVVRGSRVVATRAFGLGRDALLARAQRGERDAAVWARCVVAPIPAFEGLLPARWHFVGVPDELVTLPRALADAVAEQRGGEVEVSPLRPQVASRILAQEPLHADDLVAAGAAALAGELS